jgi:SagB-type dehydrogenase family enzyme
MAFGCRKGGIVSQAYVLSFAKGVTVIRPSTDRIVIQMPITSRECTFKGLSPGLSQAINVLSSTGATENELASLVEELDGANALTRLYYYLFTFAERRILSYGISCGDQQFATLAPASASFCFSPVPVGPQSRYTLSRFAYLHRDREDMILESPLSHGKITLHGSAAAGVTAELAKAQTLGSLCGPLQSVPRDAVALFLEMLLGAGFVSELKPDEPYLGESEVLAQWDFHDMLFHARSRLGRHSNPYGGTYRFRNRIKPLPAIKEFDAEDTIDLPRPDMSLLELQDSPFSQVLEERRSIREYGERPITALQLGEFLYRSARVKELTKMEFQDISRRPYPGGGAIYELELYLNVRWCGNVLPGLYHYCPNKHRLEKISGPTGAIDALLKDAARSAGLAEKPQILVTITARFQRLSWKYDAVAYSVLLKNVGVLYQTLYLVATAMNLAPCALGGGDSDLFARAAGLEYWEETSVGEFLLGSKRD